MEIVGQTDRNYIFVVVYLYGFQYLGLNDRDILSINVIVIIMSFQLIM